MRWRSRDKAQTLGASGLGPVSGREAWEGQARFVFPVPFGCSVEGKDQAYLRQKIREEARVGVK